MSYAKYKDLGDKGPQVDKSIMDSVPLLSSQQLKQKFINSNRVCVVDVYGDWCGPCKKVAPDFAKLAQKYNRPGVCGLAKENVDHEMSPEVTGVPAFLFYKEGRSAGVITGADIGQVESKLVELLSN